VLQNPNPGIVAHSLYIGMAEYHECVKIIESKTHNCMKKIQPKWKMMDKENKLENRYNTQQLMKDDKYVYYRTIKEIRKLFM